MVSARNAARAQLRTNASAYRRREPEGTLLHATVRSHLKTFLAQVEQLGDGAMAPAENVAKALETVQQLKK